MKKTRCVLCNATKAKRGCKERHDALICPKCCASIRTQMCEGCNYYEYAERYHAARCHTAEKYSSDKGIEREVDNALLLQEKGDIDAAKAKMDELLRMHPENHVVQYGMGVVYAFKGMYDEAILHFDKAIEIFPYFVQAHYNKAVAMLKISDMVNYLRTLKRIVIIGEEDSEFVKAARHMLLESEEHIMKHHGVGLNKYLEGERKFHEAFSHMDNAQWEDALCGFKKCTEMVAGHAQSWGNIGLCYAHLGKKELALSAIDKALEIDPLYEIAYMNRKAIERLEGGEILKHERLKTLNYYKDVAVQNKPLLETLMGEERVKRTS